MGKSFGVKVFFQKFPFLRQNYPLCSRFGLDGILVLGRISERIFAFPDIFEEWRELFDERVNFEESESEL